MPNFGISQFAAGFTYFVGAKLQPIADLLTERRLHVLGCEDRFNKDRRRRKFGCMHYPKAAIRQWRRH